MRVFFPHTSTYLVDDYFDSVRETSAFRIDTRPMNRVRLRRAAPGMRGIPHWEYDVRLRPDGDSFRKWSIYDRRINGICWHGHKLFMVTLFNDYPEVTLRSALAEYNGKESFVELHRQTNDQQWNRNSTCHC